MSRFLKLTQNIINTRQINRVIVLPNKYNIIVMNNGMNGFIFAGTGFHQSSVDIISVCAKEHPNDYKKVSDWIHSL